MQRAGSVDFGITVINSKPVYLPRDQSENVVHEKTDELRASDIDIYSRAVTEQLTAKLS